MIKDYETPAAMPGFLLAQKFSLVIPERAKRGPGMTDPWATFVLLGLPDHQTQALGPKP
jgi:hypothetical protein